MFRINKRARKLNRRKKWASLATFSENPIIIFNSTANLTQIIVLICSLEFIVCVHSVNWSVYAFMGAWEQIASTNEKNGLHCMDVERVWVCALGHKAERFNMPILQFICIFIRIFRVPFVVVFIRSFVKLCQTTECAPFYHIDVFEWWFRFLHIDAEMELKLRSYFCILES